VLNNTAKGLIHSARLDTILVGFHGLPSFLGLCRSSWEGRALGLGGSKAFRHFQLQDLLHQALYERAQQSGLLVENRLRSCYAFCGAWVPFLLGQTTRFVFKVHHALFAEPMKHNQSKHC